MNARLRAQIGGLAPSPHGCECNEPTAEARRVAEEIVMMCDRPNWHPTAPLIDAITSALRAQQQRIEELKEALRPFAYVGNELEPELWAGNQLLFAQGSGVSVEHCRRAAALLGKATERHSPNEP